MKDQKGMALIVGIVLAALVLVAVGGALYISMHAKKAGTASPLQGSPTSSPNRSPSSSPAPTQSPKPSSTFDISDLGLRFTLSGDLWDLDYKVVHLSGDQAVNSVEFASKRLEAAGCSIDTAPLGYLTYDKDKGGTVVANSRNSNLYYLQPQGGCKADLSLQNWQALESSLRSLVSD